MYETAKWLVQNGANVGAVGIYANGCSVLHCAAAQGDQEFVQALVEKHAADLRVFDDAEKTPLDYARAAGRTEVVEYLQAQIAAQEDCCVIL